MGWSCQRTLRHRFRRPPVDFSVRPGRCARLAARLRLSLGAGALCVAVVVIGAWPGGSWALGPGGPAGLHQSNWNTIVADHSPSEETAPARWASDPYPGARTARAATMTTNWAGLVDVGGTFTSVGAQWTVPSVQPSPALRSSATWVGLDGASASDPTIIQTGTTQMTSGGQTAYWAWYELYPAASVVIGGVAPGDVMHAAIAKIAAGAWSVSVQDVTSSQNFSRTFSYAGPGASAEWIEEAPANSLGQIYPLANFGSVGFRNLRVGGPTLNLSSLGQVDMVDALGRTIAYPSNIDPSSNAFSVISSLGGRGPGSSGASSHSGYDLVGSDGGVFVFPGGSGRFYGSLPGLGVSVDDIVGMVPSPTDGGYFLVGQDGGVFAFGDAPYLGSLPGLGVAVDDIRGIVPTSDNRGYFLVGQDGGVFAFGDAPFLGSLPARGIHRADVAGIAATPNDQGYWVVAGDGTVYAFGGAPQLGSAVAGSSRVSGISSTPDGGGYWIVTEMGAAYPFGDAGAFGSLPSIGVTPSSPVIGLAPTADDQGYWLIGSDGGIFAFGDAPYVGSLPGLGVGVTDIVGAVPTTV